MSRMTRRRLYILFSAWLSLCCLLRAQAQNQQSLKPGKVEFTVVDSVTHKPVRNVSVELTRVDVKQGSMSHASSDEHGQVTFPKVEPGLHRVGLVQSEGYTYETPVAGSASDIRIVVEEGATVIGGTITVIPLGMIQGTVTDEMGEPVVGADMTALQYKYSGGSKSLQSGPPEMPGTTDEQGRYKIQHLIPGRYYVRVSARSYGKIAESTRNSGTALAHTYYPNSDTPTGALHVSVSAGIETSGIDFRLRKVPTFHVRGAVTGVTSGDEKDILRLVTLQSCAPGQWELAFLTVAMLKPDGSFQAESVPPGTYCVTFEVRNRTEVTLCASDMVTVVDRDVEGVGLVAAPPFDVSGVVKIEEGASARMPYSVDLRPANLTGQPMSVGRVEKDGTFRIARVYPTDYELSIMLAPFGGAYLKSVKFGGREITDGNINTSGGGNLVIEVGAGRARVKGRIDFGSGKPMEGIRVTLAPDGPLSNRNDLIRTVLANASGEFAATDLAPGSYKILPWEKYEADLVQDPEFLGVFRAISVTVANGEQRDVEAKVISAREIEDAKAQF